MALQRIETDGIEDDAITTNKIAPNAVAAADIAADAITNVKVAAGAAIAVAKISGLGTAAALTAGTAANNVVQLDGSARLPAVSGANLTGVSTDTSAMENNIAILAFKTQAANNLAKFNLVDQVIDEYKDGTGVTFTTSGQVGSTATEGYLASVYTAVGAFTSDSDTAFLLHSDTSNGSTTFTDSSSHGRTLTAQGTSPVHSTAKQKIGASSILLNGSNGLYSTINASLTFAGDWTMEYWIWTPNSGGGSRVVGLATSNSNFQQYTRHKSQSGSYGIGQVIHSSEANSAGVAFDDDGHNVPGGVERSAISDWVHIAFVRQTKTIRAYFNGVQRVDWTKPTLYTSPTSGLLGIGYCTNCGPGEFVQSGSYLDEIRISGVCRYPDGTTFTPNSITNTSATGTATSTANTALTAPTTGDIVLLMENAAGTATLNTAGNDLRCAISRNGGTGWDYVTLVDKGSWGTNKKILTANNVAFSNSASGTDMRYKIEWANQASGSKETRVHATSLAWA